MADTTTRISESELHLALKTIPEEENASQDLMTKYGLDDFRRTLNQVELQRHHHHFLPARHRGLADAGPPGDLAALLGQEPFERPIEKFDISLLRRNLKLPRGPYADLPRPGIEQLYPLGGKKEDAGRTSSKGDKPAAASSGVAGAKGQPPAAAVAAGTGATGEAAAAHPTGTAPQASAAAAAAGTADAGLQRQPSQQGGRGRGKGKRAREAPIQDRLNKAIKGIVAHLWKHKVKGWGAGRGSPFAAVITRETAAQLGVPTYFDFVDRPMNLTWIKEKSDKKKYKTSKAFEYDCNLMFSNALKFNREGDDIHTQAGLLRAWFARRMDQEPMASVRAEEEAAMLDSGGGVMVEEEEPSSSTSNNPSKKKARLGNNQEDDTT